MLIWKILIPILSLHNRALPGISQFHQSNLMTTNMTMKARLLPCHSGEEILDPGPR
jgi:hypothetical protein